MSGNYDIEMSSDDTLELDTIIKESNIASDPINDLTYYGDSSYSESILKNFETHTTVFDPPEPGEYDINVNGQVLSINVTDTSSIPDSENIHSWHDATDIRLSDGQTIPDDGDWSDEEGGADFDSSGSPIYRDDAGDLNDQGVDFETGDDINVSSSNDQFNFIHKGKPTSVYIVLSNVLIDGNWRALLGNSHTGDSDQGFRVSNDGSQWDVTIANGSNQTVRTQASDSASHRILSFISEKGRSPELQINTDDIWQAATDNSGSTSWGSGNSAGNYEAGGGSNVGGYSASYVAYEIRVYTNSHDQETFNDVISDLSSKWDLGL